MDQKKFHEATLKIIEKIISGDNSLLSRGTRVKCKAFAGKAADEIVYEVEFSRRRNEPAGYCQLSSYDKHGMDRMLRIITENPVVKDNKVTYEKDVVEIPVVSSL